MTDLARTLSAMRGAGLMLNIVVGAGLLVLPGIVVQTVGDHALWAWAVCAMAALPLLGVFIVMGKRFPNAGGIAHFAETAFGPRAYVVTCAIFLGAVAFGLPAIALTGGYYISEVVPGNPVFHAAFFIVAATLPHLFPTDIVGKISTAVASTIVVFLLFFVATGLFAIEWDGMERNIVPLSRIEPDRVLLPFMMIFFAFTGWEVAAGLSEEFRNPERDFPRAMAISFAVACLLYFAMAFVVQNATVTGPYEASFASIIGTVLGNIGKIAVAFGAATIVFANLMGAIWAVSRMVFSLSRENHFPVALKKRKGGTPVSAISITSLSLLSVLSLDFLKLLDIDTMLSIAGQNFLILYGITGLSMLKLSKNHPERILSSLSIFIVAVLLVIQGIAIFYPVFLSVVALAVRYAAKTRDQVRAGRN